MPRPSRFAPALLALAVALHGAAMARAQAFTHFESGHVRPLALSPDGARLFAVNTPDNRLTVYDVAAGGLSLATEISTGLEPVAVAARTNALGRTEVFVVNHLSDSVSVVEIDPVDVRRSRVVRTLLVGDEPRDVVIAGSGGNRVFVTAAHRGQNRPGDPQLTTPGVGRADVWVFDAEAPGAALGGTPIALLPLFGDTPRALAVSPDRSTVYAAAFLSGNRTSVVAAQRVASNGGLPPAPPGATTGAPATALLVAQNGGVWSDELGRDWSASIPFSLPDRDVFVLDADADPPALVAGTSSVSGVGTVLFNMAVRPTNGTLYVTNTEARNAVRFETAIVGHNAESRITVVSGGVATPRHLNPHIDHGAPAGPPTEIEASHAQPTDLVFSPDGALVYVAAFGSGKIAALDADALEAGTIVADRIETGLGPSGLALDAANDRLFVMNRIDHSISIVSPASNPAAWAEIREIPLPYTPEPAAVRIGRRFLYDARTTSGHGDNSCATCHVYGDLDGLAWDLGDPFGAVIPNLLPKNNTPGVARIPFHPMKGPMTTQSLRGLADAGAMHWRGDRNGGAGVDGNVTPGGDVFDEVAAFRRFNAAFVGLQGRTEELPAADMQAFTDFILSVRYPPNPIRALDGSDSPAEAAGRTLYLTDTIFGGLFGGDGLGQTCQSCHAMPLTTTGQTALAGLTTSQEIKNPHLRNAYQKIGMFGVGPQSIPNNFLNPNSFLATQLAGDQIRGFGYGHDGVASTIGVLLNNRTFAFAAGAAGTTQRQQLEAFLLAMDTGLRPIVGQQATLAPGTAADASLLARVDLLIARAAAGDADLTVKGTWGGAARGALYVGGNSFATDSLADGSVPKASLLALAAEPGQSLTFTAVPPGSGARIALDRDEDGFRDADDNCRAAANPTQADPDLDLSGDACDNCPAKSNGDQVDADGDGQGDACDAQCIPGVTTAVTTVFPVTGAAGQLVEIQGTGFGPNVAARIGGLSAPGAVTLGRLLVSVPAGLALGPQRVTISNPEGCQSQEVVNFTVTAPAGSCGLLGFEALALAAGGRALRRLRRRSRASR